MIKRISHIAIVVPEIDQAMEFWVKTLGLPLAHAEHVPDQDVDVAFLPSGESEIELLEPIGDDSGVARFLQKRGPGMHHLCVRVEDIEAAMRRLADAGYRLLSDSPQPGAHGCRVCFVHPKSTGGGLLELSQPAD